MSTSKNVYSKKGLQAKLCSRQSLKNITDKSVFRFFTFLIVFHAFSSLEMNFFIPTESNFYPHYTQIEEYRIFWFSIFEIVF